ncbi:Transcription factor MUTE [Platanthera zijinensis]|uniref:Transcription factor MUTE n=1 Tax=Platanthera zijinensis TaxID=2320716 RepID=A0AAP0BZM3_9ASPA
MQGDQASVIGGAIEFIKEMQQLFHSLERKKKRRRSLSPTPSPKPPSLAAGELAAFCRSAAADVEAKISGSNVMLKTLSKRIPGQVVRIVAVLERQAFEILHLNISTVEDTVLYSFVIKIGLQCQLSVEELALEVQHSFSQESAF